jgi:hypothetical protein
MERKRQQMMEKYAKKKFAKDAKTLAECPYCYQLCKIPYSLIISESEHVFLMYPTKKKLAQNECWIIPKEHVESFAKADENVYAEARNYMKSVVEYYKKFNKSAIFMEIVHDIKNCLHTYIDCVPIDTSLLQEAKQAFKQSLLESDENYAENPKVIDTVPYRGNIKKLMPANLPYFHVDFDATGGFAHTIENKDKFLINFGQVRREFFCNEL